MSPALSQLRLRSSLSDDPTNHMDQAYLLIQQATSATDSQVSVALLQRAVKRLVQAPEGDALVSAVSAGLQDSPVRVRFLLLKLAFHANYDRSSLGCALFCLVSCPAHLVPVVSVLLPVHVFAFAYPIIACRLFINNRHCIMVDFKYCLFKSFCLCRRAS